MENEAMNIMENVTEAVVENNTIEPIPCESANASLASALIRFTLISGVVVGGFLLLKKDEIKERRTQRSIKKLEKAGYTVIKTEAIVDETEEGCDVEVAD